MRFEREAKAQVLQDATDPDSVKFRDTRVAKMRGAKRGGYIFCAEVNSKNIMGGFTGWNRVTVRGVVDGKDVFTLPAEFDVDPLRKYFQQRWQEECSAS